MTTISRKGSRARPPYLVPVLFVLCILLLVGIIMLRKPFASALWRVAAPVAGVSNAVRGGFSGFTAQFASKAQLAKENAALREALASSSVALLDRNALYEENLALKGKSLSVPHDAKVASVLMRPPASPYDTLVIDLGSRDGIVQGDRVSAGGGSAIGAVSEVYTTTSRVTLYSAPGVTHEALVRTAAGDVPLTVSGHGSGSMSAELPAATQVKAGDLVVFAGAASQFMGTVAYIEQTQGSSFMTLYLHLPINLFQLRSVEVYPLSGI
jgi:rod shape-determining protein MreC